MKDTTYLPVGSVVLLKGATKKVVILGYAVKEEKEDKIWDYLGAPFPIGVIKSDMNLLFDKKQIKEVVHIGYKDEDSIEFLEALERDMKKIKKNG